MLSSSNDLIVVGAGNSVSCTALAAAVHGVSTLVLKRVSIEPTFVAPDQPSPARRLCQTRQP